MKKNNTNLFFAISLLIIGALFCALRSGFVSVLLTVVGALLIVVGVVAIVQKEYALGAVEIAVGIVIIACGWTIVDITLLILGIVFVIYAIYNVIANIPALKRLKGADLALKILYPVVIFVFGVILIVARWYMIDAVFIVIGVLSILAGLSMLLDYLKVTKK